VQASVMPGDRVSNAPPAELGHLAVRLLGPAA
jgi:hypothetical protein